jgi:ammonia channel protein AmtB
MFDYRNIFRWDQFITPTIIKPLFTLIVGLVALSALSGIFSGLAMMAISPFGGFIVILMSLLGAIVAIVVARVACEFVLITFRINEHLGAIRDQGGMR